MCRPASPRLQLLRLQFVLPQCVRLEFLRLQFLPLHFRRLQLLMWVLCSHAALAHHSVLAFDGTRGTTISGTVTKIVWRNPHARIYLDAQAAEAIEHWAVESESPTVLHRLGWVEGAIEVGDRVTIVGARAKDGSYALRCKHIELADGRMLSCFPSARQ